MASNFIPLEVVSGRAPGVCAAFWLFELLIIQVLVGFFGVFTEKQRAEEHLAEGLSVLLGLRVRDSYAVRTVSAVLISR